jgi:hypothetical protein
MPTQTKVNCCPRCKGEDFVGNSKGYGVGKALAGAALLGPVGLVAGLAGSGKVVITCVSCGFRVKPGELSTKTVVHYEPGEKQKLDELAEAEKQKLWAEQARDRKIAIAKRAEDAANAEQLRLQEEAARLAEIAGEKELVERAVALGHSRSDIAVFGVRHLLQMEDSSAQSGGFQPQRIIQTNAVDKDESGILKQIWAFLEGAKH